ncbi:CotO family spore coat protein [Metabacillus malikii]|uniref:Spore coat protein CotO n=1 Tax=Metabacillus malikii TaxID=1504265 RepID=A0ABT9ZEG7_9BACI|nr:CotO family spore coat protein [Metabacillus malikii]MDQ0230638.1 hypothetical protein [Metabacillus malikii]
MSHKQTQYRQAKPLMYIVQPDGINVDVKMQSFVVKKAKKQVESVIEEEVKEIDEPQLQIEVVDQEVPITQQEPEVPTATKEVVEEVQEEEPPQSAKQYRKQRKPISQMTIEEKVDFFKNLPKNMPRTLCLIETTEEKYRGVIITEENKIVTIRSLHHTKPIQLPINQIKEINLLGF